MNTATKTPPPELDHYQAHTTASLARACGVSYTTCSRWLRDGQVSFVRAEAAAAFVVSKDEIVRLRARSEKQLASKAARFDAHEIETIFRRAMPAPPTPQAFAH